MSDLNRHESTQSLRSTVTRLERELTIVTAERDKLRGIIYRSTCDRLNG